MKYQLQEIFSKFHTKSKSKYARSFGSGHINDTYIIEEEGSSKRKFILQRINNNVFRNVPELQDNIWRVTEHLKSKIQNSQEATTIKKSLSLFLTEENSTYYQDESGNYWRLYAYISDTCSYDKAPDVDVCYQGGLAFGEFQNLLSDMDGDPLYETIPKFSQVLLCRNL